MMKSHFDGYRPCVGIVLFNQSGEVFAGMRDDAFPGCQMPQGGIEEGEVPLDALYREVREEINLSPDMYEVCAEYPEWLYYDVPDAKELWGEGYKGQKQTWFLARFLANDSDILLNVMENPEFVSWKWMDFVAMCEQVWHFKKKVYDALYLKFNPLILRQVSGQGH